MTLTNILKSGVEMQIENFLSGNSYFLDLGTGYGAESVNDTSLSQAGSISRVAVQTQTLDRSEDTETVEFWVSSVNDNDLLTTANYNNSGTDTDLNLGSTNWISQGFKVPLNLNVTKINISGKYDSGSPVPNATLMIQTGSANVPTGSVVTNATGSITAFYTSGAQTWRTCTFSTPPAITSGTEYCVVLHASGASSGSIYKIEADASSPTYADGCYGVSTNGGSAWTATTGTDVCFQVFGNKFQENGLFSASTAGSLYARNLHTAITKDANTEVLLTYTIKHDVRVNE